MTIVYISGPMAGYPDHNFPAFIEAEAQLRKVGVGVRNPISNGLPQGLPWSDYLRTDLHMVLDSDAVAVLPNWEASRGARLEVEVAQRLGIPVLPLALWLASVPVSVVTA